MNDDKIIKASRQFNDEWRARGNEKSDAQAFWLAFFRDVMNVPEPEKLMQFEKPIDVDDHKCFIDALIPSTRVLIEQKSRGIDLDKPARQSDGSVLTPFEQAKRYADALPYSQKPRWIVVCNFDEIRIHDMDHPARPFNSIALDKIEHEIARLQFLIDPNDENVEEVKISKDAAQLIDNIRAALERQLIKIRLRNNTDKFDKTLPPEQSNALNKLCVRLVFCLYAEDAALFKHNQFVDFVKANPGQTRAIAELFRVLNTPRELRPTDLRAELDAFPYVNGGLFAEDALDMPGIDNHSFDLLTIDAADDRKINWFKISPPIFGALFESAVDDDERRTGGMHYTSIANIHKLIDPLFMDALDDEFQSIRRKRKDKRWKLEAFQDKLASLTFLDPACGSGNFLTETFISLRRLENKVLDELLKLDAACTVKVTIDQFFGIELDSFACAIAQTAMWISEHQMLQETDDRIRKKIPSLPLRHSARIVCGNSLQLDWAQVTLGEVDFIIGNPPFVGRRYQTDAQRADIERLFKYKDIDYVACWFKRAAQFMLDTTTRAAFVATNSIVQGEQVAAVWKEILSVAHIDFAYRTFKWTIDSDAINKAAAVHCVIIGFSTAPNPKPRVIFDGDRKIIARNINAYLLDGANFFVENRSKPLCNVPKMRNGNMFADGRHLIIKADEYDDFIRREPAARKFIRPLLGAEEFINGKLRYCLWLVDATADDLKLPLIAERVEAVRQFRLHSTFKHLVDTPHLFRDRNDPARCIIVPMVSSERRRYIPIGFLLKGTITTTQVQMIPNATLFHFGVLNSSVHMAWMRVVAGRLKSDYRYSSTIVYNNFPWCPPSPAIERTAQSILDVRSRYPDRSLASLYDDSTMPDELRAAHTENDRAVLSAYGFSESMSEAEIVARLMQMYQRLTETASHE